MDSESDELLKDRPPQLFSIVFNTCIIMMLFNQINSRVLLQQRNVFGGLQHNRVFTGIWIGNFIAQVKIFASLFALVIISFSCIHSFYIALIQDTCTYTEAFSAEILQKRIVLDACIG